MSEMMGGKALVTGGAGFIGSHLVDALLKEGFSVRVVDNLANGSLANLSSVLDSPRFEFHKGTITDPYCVRDAMCNVDLVFHLACLGVRHSISRPFENHRVNAEGTLIVLEEARKAGVRRFLACSSSEVYGTALHVPMTEDHPTLPCTVYGSSKLAGEAYARAYHRTYGFPVVIVRPFNTFGPRSHNEGDAGEVIPRSIVSALNNEPVVVFGQGGQTRDFTYVEDTAQGLLRAALRDDLAGRTLNLGSSFEISILELVRKIVAFTGSGSKIRHEACRPGDVDRLLADSTRFHELTGWKPAVSFDQGLQHTIAWFKSRPEGLRSLLESQKTLNWT